MGKTFLNINGIVIETRLKNRLVSFIKFNVFYDIEKQSNLC